MVIIEQLMVDIIIWVRNDRENEYNHNLYGNLCISNNEQTH